MAKKEKTCIKSGCSNPTLDNSNYCKKHLKSYKLELTEQTTIVKPESISAWVLKALYEKDEERKLTIFDDGEDE